MPTNGYYPNAFKLFVDLHSFISGMKNNFELTILKVKFLKLGSACMA
jgi:hypothetical protein